MALIDLHLADLHERARRAGVPGFRMLTRAELIAALEGEPTPDVVDAPPQESEPAEAGPPPGRGREAKRDAEPE
ncbi:MAG: hypothetical protein ACRDKH_00940, partial [Solirubrobacterales bacterium]